MHKLQTITIYEKPYSLNKYRNEHFHKLNKLKSDWTNSVKLNCLFNKIQPVDKCELRFIFMFKDSRKRDIDNYAATVKMVIDGLVISGIIPDDNWNHVLKIEMMISVKAKVDGVRVDIIGGVA